MIFQNDDLGFEPQTVAGGIIHVVGSIGIVAAGLVSVPATWWWAAAIEFLVNACLGRAGLLSSLAGLAVLGLFNPWRMRLSASAVVLFVVLGIALFMFSILDLNFGANSRGREISPAQLVENLLGSFASTEDQSNDLDGTRQWRMMIWNKIIDYTVFGPYFWTGKGYGINIIDDAGMSHGQDERPARNPENSHLTFLARSGVPGFGLWVVLQLTWAVGILRALSFARRTGRRRTAGTHDLLPRLLVGNKHARCRGTNH